MDNTTTSSRVWGTCKWLLAMAGVFGAYLLIQVVTMGLGSVVVGVAAALSTGDYESFVESPAFSNMVLGLSVVAQLAIIAVFLPMWRRMRPGSFVVRREAVAPSGVSFAKSLALLLVIGVSAQFFVGGILEIVELLFPEAMAEYSELMEDTSVGVFAIVSALSIAVLAPINEEIVCRGVMFEYAMRAMSPGWNAIDGARYRAVSARAFWIANALQALAFGVLHMNLIQGGLRLRARGRPGLGVMAHGQASLPDHPALRDERLVVFGRAIGAHGQRAARASRARHVWGPARGRHHHVRARMARLGRPARGCGGRGRRGGRGLGG